jgi:hypothetical protein
MPLAIPILPSMTHSWLRLPPGGELSILSLTKLLFPGSQEPVAGAGLIMLVISIELLLLSVSILLVHR